MRHFSVAGLAVAILFSSAPAHAQQQGVRFRVGNLMSAAEQQRTGIAVLDSAQRAALNEWLTEYTISVLRYAQTNAGVSSGGFNSYSSEVDYEIRPIRITDMEDLRPLIEECDDLGQLEMYRYQLTAALDLEDYRTQIESFYELEFEDCPPGEEDRGIEEQG